VKRLLGRPAHRSENNIKINLREMDCEDVDDTELAHNTVQCDNVDEMFRCHNKIDFIDS
jgi:hypothetical protein